MTNNKEEHEGVRGKARRREKRIRRRAFFIRKCYCSRVTGYKRYIIYGNKQHIFVVDICCVQRVKIKVETYQRGLENNSGLPLRIRASRECPTKKMSFDAFLSQIPKRMSKDI